MKKLTFDRQQFSIQTTLGTLTGRVHADGSITVETPRTPEGKDTYIYISRIGYRFSFGFRANGGTDGLCLIYREGQWCSGEGVTPKASSTIWAVTREVHTLVMAHPSYKVAEYFAKRDVRDAEIKDVEGQIERLQKRLAELRKQ